MFARVNGQKSIIGDYYPMLRNFLEKGQNIHSELFTTGAFIGDFSLRIIPRHGANTEADKNNVYISVIKMINWWRKR